MNRRPLVTSLIVLAALGAACAREPAPPMAPEEIEIVARPEFEEINWRLLEYRSETGDMTSVLDEIKVDVKFSAGQLGGSAGCNRYFGAYTLDEESGLSIGSEIGSTQMACIPEVMDQEQKYLALLGQAVAIDRNGDHLLLHDPDSAILLEFVATEPQALEATEWQATGINNGSGGVVSTGTTAASTAIFAAGQLSGHGGCNRFTATYEVIGNQITIGPATATRMLCNEPEGIMDQELQYFAALGRARSFSLTPDKLELRDEKGSLQVGFPVLDE